MISRGNSRLKEREMESQVEKEGQGVKEIIRRVRGGNEGEEKGVGQIRE